jgi:hypothetical protein
LTKGALLKILDRTKPNLGAFRAITADAEVVLNDRPLENPSSSTEEEMKEEHRLVIRVKKPVYSYEQVARFRELDLKQSSLGFKGSLYLLFVYTFTWTIVFPCYLKLTSHASW